jgi:hypothetical protein
MMSNSFQICFLNFLWKIYGMHLRGHVQTLFYSDIFPHMEGLYSVHQVDLHSGEGGELICFEFYISHSFY